VEKFSVKKTRYEIKMAQLKIGVYSRMQLNARKITFREGVF